MGVDCPLFHSSLSYSSVAYNNKLHINSNADLLRSSYVFKDHIALFTCPVLNQPVIYSVFQRLLLWKEFLIPPKIKKTATKRKAFAASNFLKLIFLKREFENLCHCSVDL